MKLIDVSVPLDANLPTYPGNTPFSLEAIKRIANGDSSNVSALHLSAHTGTHVDAPYHYGPVSGGLPAKTIDQIPLQWCIGAGVLLDFSSFPAGAGINKDDIVQEWLESDTNSSPTTSC